MTQSNQLGLPSLCPPSPSELQQNPNLLLPINAELIREASILASNIEHPSLGGEARARLGQIVTQTEVTSHNLFRDRVKSSEELRNNALWIALVGAVQISSLNMSIEWVSLPGLLLLLYRTRRFANPITKVELLSALYKSYRSRQAALVEKMALPID